MDISYEFARPSGAGRQHFRILPASLPGRQRVLGSTVTLQPEPGELGHFTDFFGTAVVEAAIPAGLTRLDLSLEAQVERLAPIATPDLSANPGQLAAELAAIRMIGPGSPLHFLQPSRRIPQVEAISRFAAGALQPHPGTSTRALIERLGLMLHDYMGFEAGVTDAATPPAQAFAAKRGVCQDFAQIMVGGLRSLGVPAAYVAGYLRTQPPPGQPRLVGADAMHAWVRAWGGEFAGWIDYDPTNACFPGADHIDVGMGRDYGDVAPVTGMLRLDGLQEGRHSVDITEAE
ncbi:transglutaminase family protein [Xinfangfangia sp. D13-10-4-6]|nr:transglutaminase family protein [Pseudogemmobacter hezensis]NPD14326.1 transglutaminase family protein [Pseudogemmobacter hezensis]